jgi:hypothetical protein
LNSCAAAAATGSLDSIDFWNFPAQALFVRQLALNMPLSRFPTGKGMTQHTADTAPIF